MTDIIGETFVLRNPTWISIGCFDLIYPSKFGKLELINLIKSRKAGKQAKLKEIENEKSNLLEETNNLNILSEEIEINEGKDKEQTRKNLENLIKFYKNESTDNYDN